MMYRIRYGLALGLTLSLFLNAQAQVNVSETGIRLVKLEGKAGRREDGRPNCQSVPIAGRNYITLGEIDSTYNYDENYAWVVPYVIASGQGKIYVTMKKLGDTARVIGSQTINVNSNQPKQEVINVLYNVGQLRETGTYAMSFEYNGATIGVTEFSVGEPSVAATASNGGVAQPQYVTCGTCQGTGWGENTEGKIQPNGSIKITKRTRVRCWSCNGAGKVQINN